MRKKGAEEKRILTDNSPKVQPVPCTERGKKETEVLREKPLSSLKGKSLV